VPVQQYLRKYNVYNKLYNADHTARLNFVIWYLHMVHDRKKEPTVQLVNGKLGFNFMDV
jgi:hypothetical protein